MECAVKLKSDSIGRYVSIKDSRVGPVCQGAQVTNLPFGQDPTFSSTSQIYKGYVDLSAFYTNAELNSAGNPFGFFSHSYDGLLHGPKDPQFVMDEEASNFKVYFTERVTAAAANNLVAYLRDGGFLDSQTQEVTVDVPTLNSNLNLFAIFTFIFTWQVSSLNLHFAKA